MSGWKGDPNAFHTVVDGEIAGLTEKGSPASGDWLLIEDAADSNSKKKVDWGNLPSGGGGGGGLTLIDDELLASAASAITFSSIPSTFQSLLLVCRLRTDNAAIYGASAVRVGNSTLDTGSNYSWGRKRDGDVDDTAEGNSDSSWYGALVAGAMATSGRFGTLVVRIVDYADTSQWRHAYIEGAVTPNSTNTAFTRTIGLWENTTDAIDIVSVLDYNANDLVAGSQVSLYGVS